jgi:hypothetical protein
MYQETRKETKWMDESALFYFTFFWKKKQRMDDIVE